MPEPSCICPKCGTRVYIVSSKSEERIFGVVCPGCLLSFKVQKVVGVNTKTGLPQEERYELDPRHIL